MSLMQSFLQTSLEYSKEGKGSKSRLSFELPRIGKGDANDHSGPIALHFHWLTQPKDYSSTSMPEIESEYLQLRRQLVLLNQQAARNVERISIKSVKKSNKTIDSGKAIETCLRETDNNTAIIARLRIELQQLQKRISAIQQTGKDDIESSIQDTKEQITYLRHKNKELQQKSKQIGSNIQAGDEVFNQVRKLEVELSIAERKKAKLQLKSKETSENLQKVRKQLGELKGDAVDAECYIQQQLQESRVERVEKRFESLYRQRTYHLQAIRKNQQSISNIKQQKYHQCLKQLEQLAARIQRSEESINLAEQRHLQSRDEIISLQQKLNAVIQAQRERKKQQVVEEQVLSSHEKENDKSGRSKEQSPLKKNNYRKKIRAEEKPSQDFRSSQQSNNKIRLLNLRFNKSQNKKQDKEKMSHTIDSASTQQHKNKQKQVMKSFEQSTLSYQMPITSNPKVNSAELQQNTAIKNKQMVAKTNTCEDCCFMTENIEEEIGDSFIKEKAGDKEKPSLNQWTSVERERESKSVIETPKDKVVEEDVDDEDLLDFKRSIQAELTSPFSGLKHVDIALGQIQDSIRKHQSKSRQQQLYQESSIAQQEQQLA